MILTNFGAIDQSTTMGVATGDLRGAVSGTQLLLSNMLKTHGLEEVAVPCA
jgi:hypothetical protein